MVILPDILALWLTGFAIPNIETFNTRTLLAERCNDHLNTKLFKKNKGKYKSLTFFLTRFKKLIYVGYFYLFKLT